MILARDIMEAADAMCWLLCLWAVVDKAVKYIENDCVTYEGRNYYSKSKELCMRFEWKRIN